MLPKKLGGLSLTSLQLAIHALGGAHNIGYTFPHVLTKNFIIKVYEIQNTHGYRVFILSFHIIGYLFWNKHCKPTLRVSLHIDIMYFGYMYVKHLFIYHFPNLCKYSRLFFSTHKFACISFCGL